MIGEIQPPGEIAVIRNSPDGEWPDLVEARQLKGSDGLVGQGLEIAAGVFYRPRDQGGHASLFDKILRE
jgi:hypothetical protein